MKLFLRTLLIASALALLAPTGSAWAKRNTSDDAVVQGALGRRLAAAVEQAGGHDFWGSVLVARDGEVVFAKGYGSADYNARANTPRTLFELASVSKQITAAAVLHLQQKRKLKVTDTLDEFFDDVPAEKRPIQVHHLLTHTSGISDAEASVPYSSTLSRGPYVRHVLSIPLATKPGERFAYSNVGYALLAAIVEEVSRRSFEAYIETYLFKPARMKESGFIGDKDLRKSKRNSTRRTKDGRSWTASDWHWGWGYRGMGGVVTTALDLYRWDRALRDGKVLDEAQREQMATPVSDGYAYGWYAERTAHGTRKLWHSGGVAGYGIWFVRYLEDDACVIVLSNAGQAAYEVATAIEGLLFEAPKLEAEIDLRPYEPDSNRVVRLPNALQWKTVRHRHELVLRLVDRRHAILEVRAPKSYRYRLIGKLEQATASTPAEAASDEAAWDATLRLRAYNPSDRKIRLRSKVALDVRSEGGPEGGRSGDDRAVCLYLVDGKHGGRPVRVAMNATAARSLLEVLRRVAK